MRVATRDAVAFVIAVVAGGACFVAGSCASSPVLSGSELARSFGLVPQPPAEGGVAVRVVDEKGGDPIAGALVVAVDEHDFSYGFSAPDLADVDTASVLREIGTAYLTDERGMTHVATAAMPQSLFAWHGGDVGRATLEVHDRETCEISVAPRVLAVEVVDRDGRPQAGVPVVLGGCAGEVGNPGACRAVTDSNGRAAFPAIDLERSVHRTCRRRALVMLGVPCGLHAFRAIDAPELEPVGFTLPDGGELHVDLVDETGVPLAREAVAELHARVAIRSAPVHPCSWCGDEDHTMYVDVEDNPIRVPHVDLGRDLSLTLWIRTSEESGVAARHYTAFASGDDGGELRGPARAGAVVHARLAVPLQRIADARSERRDAPPHARPSIASAPGPVDESTPSSVTVRVRLDAPLSSYCVLRARWRDDDAAGKPIGPSSPFGDIAWLDVTGHATLRDVLPGTWTFAITLVQEGEDEAVLVEVPHVVVGPGLHLRDPRLLSIELPGNSQASK